MSIDDNKAFARRFLQVWMPGNLGLVDELATSDISPLDILFAEGRCAASLGVIRQLGVIPAPAQAAALA